MSTDYDKLRLLELSATTVGGSPENIVYGAKQFEKYTKLSKKKLKKRVREDVKLMREKSDESRLANQTWITGTAEEVAELHELTKTERETLVKAVRIDGGDVMNAKVGLAYTVGALSNAIEERDAALDRADKAWADARDMRAEQAKERLENAKALEELPLATLTKYLDGYVTPLLTTMQVQGEVPIRYVQAISIDHLRELAEQYDLGQKAERERAHQLAEDDDEFFGTSPFGGDE